MQHEHLLKTTAPLAVVPQTVGSRQEVQFQMTSCVDFSQETELQNDESYVVEYAERVAGRIAADVVDFPAEQIHLTWWLLMRLPVAAGGLLIPATPLFSCQQYPKFEGATCLNDHSMTLSPSQLFG